MIKNEQVTISVSYRNVTHYMKLGYNAIINENLKIKTIDLPSTSHVRIDAICEICKVECNLRWHKYLENKNRHGFYGCRGCSRQKAKMTSQKNWGVDNWMQLDEAKEIVANNNIEKYGVKTTLLEPNTILKIKKTMVDRYGSEYTFSSAILMNRLKNEDISSDASKLDKYEMVLKAKSITIEINPSEDRYEEVYNDDLRLYSNEVRRLTKKNIKKLLEDWDGVDYYDNEYIKDNFSLYRLDGNYPTIDHKISIYAAYKRNLLPLDIADISNLCITKRCINSAKSSKTDIEFLS